jgi:hypothetical protein
MAGAPALNAMRCFPSPKLAFSITCGADSPAPNSNVSSEVIGSGFIGLEAQAIEPIFEH